MGNWKKTCLSRPFRRCLVLEESVFFRVINKRKATSGLHDRDLAKEVAELKVQLAQALARIAELQQQNAQLQQQLAKARKNSSNSSKPPSSNIVKPTKRNAVGTAVAGSPPHRSVREELPHTAPPLGITVKMTSSLPAVAARVDASHCPARCPVRPHRECFPLGDPLSSAGSAIGVPVLFAHFAGTMGPSDFLFAFMSALPS